MAPLAALAFVSLGLPDGLLGVAWPSMRAAFGVELDALGLLLAVSVGGAPLTPGRGAPVRLVVPGRRGFHWVKWVTRIEHDERPWWLEPPLPLR